MLLVTKLDLFAVGTIILPKLEILAMAVVDAKINMNKKISIHTKIDTNTKISIEESIFFISPHTKRNFDKHYAKTNQRVGYEDSKM